MYRERQPICPRWLTTKWYMPFSELHTWVVGGFELEIKIRVK